MQPTQPLLASAAGAPVVVLKYERTGMDPSNRSLAELLSSRSSSTPAFLPAFISRRNAAAPRFNSLINSFSEENLALQSDAAKGKPLEGCVLLIKDCIEWQGSKTTGGLSHSMMPHFVAAEDAPVAAALREAGAVCIGKANLP